jgi:hypothetical protein
MIRLDEYDKIEWRDVARLLRPDWDDEDFEREWAEFMRIREEWRNQCNRN